MKNLEIREFKISIENYVNTTGLPTEVKRMVLKEIYDRVSAEADKSIIAEISERDEKEREEKSE